MERSRAKEIRSNAGDGAMQRLHVWPCRRWTGSRVAVAAEQNGGDDLGYHPSILSLLRNADGGTITIGKQASDGRHSPLSGGVRWVEPCPPLSSSSKRQDQRIGSEARPSSSLASLRRRRWPSSE
nr:hypothetical protein Iba_chr13bCG13070 [Ipomoea batatas]